MRSSGGIAPMITETVSLRITLPPCAPDLTAWPVSTIVDASGIQKTIRAIALWPVFLWIERTIDGGEQASIGLKRKSRS
jgi:hypothetical protein